MSNISELRSVLFDTLQSVKEGKMEIDRAKAVSDIAQTIINTAKVEIDYIRATDANITTDFLGNQTARVAGTPPTAPSIALQLHQAGRK